MGVNLVKPAGQKGILVNGKEYFTNEQVAEMCGVSVDTVKGWIYQPGKVSIEAAKFETNFFIEKDELKRYLNEKYAVKIPQVLKEAK